MVQLTGQSAIVKSETIIESQLSQIESRISTLFDTNDRMKQAVSRLLNPRPEDASKNAPDVPQPHTVEGRLQNIVRRLDMVSTGFMETVSTLDTAI